MQEVKVDMISNISSFRKIPKGVLSIRKLLVIHYEEESNTTSCIHMPKTMIVEVLGHFVCKDNRVVS